MLDMETVQLYISDNYLDAACASDVAELVRSRMDGYKAMKIGSVAPDFVIRDWLGSTIQLSSLEHPYILVLFWASTCEHCREMLPRLHRWYVEEREMDRKDRALDLEVVALSLDTLEANFQRYTEMLGPEWIHALDPRAWTGKIAADYFIYATPSLFLLDEELRIIARPRSFRQFLKAIEKLEE